MSEDKLNFAVKKVVEQSGYSCWGVKFNTTEHHAVLRVFIDCPEGVTLDDCSSVSHQLSGVLDVEGVINKPYTLEVSSPGVERPLFTIEHYRCYIGRKVRISCHAPIDGKRNFIGKIGEVNARTVILRTNADDIEIPVDAVRQARLIFEPA